MLRISALILCFLSFGLSAHAQSEEEIAAARLAYIDADYATALAVLRPAADAGNAMAQNIMGAAYEDGNGVPVDMAVALEWYEKSAAQDFPRAVHNLGLIYENGSNSVEADHQKAIGYYDRAVALDYAPSLNNRGYMHELGKGGARDIDAAIALYKRAAELGNINSMNNLGQLYVNDPDAPEEIGDALDLFRSAAETGDATGLNNLGAMYANGYGVGQDRLAAMGLYRMAAARQHGQAANNLAYLLSDASSAFAAPVEAMGWCILSIEWAKPADAQDFRDACDEIAAELDDETIAAGLEWARNW